MSEFIEFTCNSAAVKAALEQCAERILIESAAMLESQVKRNTVVDSAHTKESWDHVIDLSKNEAIVGSPLENAVWEEFGTGEYALSGNGRKGGWCYRSESGNFYFTNGKPPKRAFQKAYSQSREQAILLAKENFKAMKQR